MRGDHPSFLIHPLALLSHLLKEALNLQADFCDSVTCPARLVSVGSLPTLVALCKGAGVCLILFRSQTALRSSWRLQEEVSGTPVPSPCQPGGGEESAGEDPIADLPLHPPERGAEAVAVPVAGGGLI